MARGKQITKQITKTTSECLELFLKHCQTKNLSKPTLKTYRLECNSFNEWYGEERSIYDVSAETIEEYISFLQEKEISQTYVATKIRQLRVFMYFCMEREYL